MKLTTSAQMRELDRIAIEERHIPSVELMERAAEGVAAAVLTLLPDQAAHCRIAALCGEQRRRRYRRRAAAVFQRNAGAVLPCGKI